MRKITRPGAENGLNTFGAVQEVAGGGFEPPSSGL